MSPSLFGNRVLKTRQWISNYQLLRKVIILLKDVLFLGTNLGLFIMNGPMGARKWPVICLLIVMPFMRLDTNTIRSRTRGFSSNIIPKETKMVNLIRSVAVKIILGIATMAILNPCTAIAASRAEIDRDVDFALQKLYDSSQTARMLSERAKAILVFPAIVKAGFILGGQYGDGALLVKNRTSGYYRTVSFSYGLQAGVQSFGYALFFMSYSAVDYLRSSNGWEIGVGPSVVIVDKGVAKALTTTTAKDDIYAFFFDQKGMMAGLGLQGTKITKCNPK